MFQRQVVFFSALVNCEEVVDVDFSLMHCRNPSTTLGLDVRTLVDRWRSEQSKSDGVCQETNFSYRQLCSFG